MRGKRYLTRLVAATNEVFFSGINQFTFVLHLTLSETYTPGKIHIFEISWERHIQAKMTKGETDNHCGIERDLNQHWT